MGCESETVPESARKKARSLTLSRLRPASGISDGFIPCVPFCSLPPADVNARMTVVMKIKMKEHRKCVEQHECPTVAPAMANVPCRLSPNSSIITCFPCERA